MMFVILSGAKDPRDAGTDSVLASFLGGKPSGRKFGRVEGTVESIRVLRYAQDDKC